MLGMIMPDRKVPNFCTATRTLFARLTGASAFTAICASVPSGAHAPADVLTPRSVATTQLH
jgi:hypothetical protein